MQYKESFTREGIESKSESSRREKILGMFRVGNDKRVAIWRVLYFQDIDNKIHEYFRVFN